jgi:hypothetical protein
VNALLAFIPKPVLAGLVIALGIATGVQSCTVRKQAGEVAKARVAVDQAEQVNETNVANIVDLETQLNEVRAEWETDVATHDKALNEWNVERVRLEAEANEKEIERIEVFRDPTCSDLAKINITAICPDFVRGMRQRADSLNGN